MDKELEGLHNVSCKPREKKQAEVCWATAYLTEGWGRERSQTHNQKWFHSKQEF